MGQSLVLESCTVPALLDHETFETLNQVKPLVPHRAEDLLRGVVEIVGATAVGAATRLALAEAIAAVLSRTAGAQSHIEVTRSPISPRAPPRTLRFAYAVRFEDPEAVPAARKLLEAEAVHGGRKRLLPRFAAALSKHGEAPPSESELRVADFTVQSFVSPFKGGDDDKFHDITALCSAPLRDDPLAFLQAPCGGQDLGDMAARPRPRRSSSVEPPPDRRLRLPVRRRRAASRSRTTVTAGPSPPRAPPRSVTPPLSPVSPQQLSASPL